jgi:hypothetical protein
MTKAIEIRSPASGFEYHGWTVAPEDVREIATKMDVPKNVLLPEVIVAGEDSDEELLKTPFLFTVSKKEDPSGFVITIPESMVKEASKTHYVLGHRVKENIGHELAHYLEHVETGTKTDREDDPYSAAAKELRADIRAKRQSLSRCLAIVIRTLVRDYGLSVVDAYKIADKAAKDLGLNEQTINNAKKRYREDRI